jgi:hypothetical protein
MKYGDFDVHNTFYEQSFNYKKMGSNEIDALVIKLQFKIYKEHKEYTSTCSK